VELARPELDVNVDSVRRISVCVGYHVYGFQLADLRLAAGHRERKGKGECQAPHHPRTLC
jgi:hypothetical protein